MKAVRMLQVGALFATLALGTMGTAVPAGASSPTNHTIKVEDRCDVKTFNAALGNGACVDTGRGSVTFDEFLDELTDGGDGHWRFDPDERTIDRGDKITAVNTGGEFHTFTEVAKFGKGCVPLLDVAIKEQNVDNCHLLDPADALPAGGKLTRTPTTLGVHRYECLIHPWMRTTVTVEAD